MVTKLYLVGVCCIILGFLSWGLFFVIGSTVDENGMLQEPFGLLPIGILLVVVGVTISILTAVTAFIKKFKPIG